MNVTRPAARFRIRLPGVLMLLIIPAMLASCAPAGLSKQDQRAGPARRPNILLIMADDLGYSDVGVFGGEIPTPNIDRLAQEGRIYTNMYATPLCAITRAELISGTDHHLVGLGTMLQPTGRQKGAPGYEGYLTDRALSVAEVLRDGGYHTYMSGKWHLGMQEDQSPKARGFEHSFALLPGGGEHIITSASRLSDADRQILRYRENGVLVPLPENVFSTDFFTDRLISYIDQHRGDGKPFFAWAAYTAPHWPLQAPEQFIERQRGRYDDGYAVIRQRRIERQRQLGIIPPGARPALTVPDGPESPGQVRSPAIVQPEADPRSWDELSAHEREVEARRMEIYAAMVEHLDWNIGRLIQHLKDIGEYENTLIIFTSDNGAASGGFPLRNMAGVDNGYANMGRPGSYVTFTPRWAEVSNTPLSLWKQTTAEGGVAVPMIVHLPGQTSARTLSRATIAVKDFAPTFAQVAGIEVSGTSYDGREVFPWTGASLLPLFEGRVAQAHSEDTVFADESDYAYYVRQGQWKAMYIPELASSDHVRLYNLRDDRGETTDLAAAEPEVLKKMTELYRQYVQRVGVMERDESLKEAAPASTH